ncbi:MAG: aldo/keto reductase [Coriobacteriia bacterium]|nr:aldo/keto reductase [Coriobacteriia bacterium]
MVVMRYRIDTSSRNELSVLGLGCMRFPRDKAETERIILAALDGGVNFFDTAYIYPGSEVILGEALAKHGRREDIFLSTKLPLSRCRRSEDFDKYFDEQLKRLQTDYIDYYFMHNIASFAQWEALLKMGIAEWIAGKKASGEIRQVGFSYHGTYDDFLKTLKSYPWEFCLIQYNYYDENYQAGKAGLRAAVNAGLTVMVMEPLLGGKLATGLPRQAEELFNRANPDLAPADWALWWLWNQPEVTLVLSGMSSADIVRHNLQSAEDFRTLSEEELAVYPKVVDVFRKSYKVNCTSCNYCLPCPKGINIPSCLAAYNTSYARDYVAGATLYLTSTAVLAENPLSVHLCNQCGKCEKACPQDIPIRTYLKKVGRRFEPLPVRWILKLVRAVMSR